MNEQLQSSHEQITGPASGGGIFDEPLDALGEVLVSSGPHSDHLPLANMTVGEIRARFRDRFDIDEQARAVLDGVDVTNDTIVRQGQVLMFTHRAGEKGLGLFHFPGHDAGDTAAGHPPRWRPCAMTIHAGKSPLPGGPDTLRLSQVRSPFAASFYSWRGGFSLSRQVEGLIATARFVGGFDPQRRTRMGATNRSADRDDNSTFRAAKSPAHGQ